MVEKAEELSSARMVLQMFVFESWKAVVLSHAYLHMEYGLHHISMVFEILGIVPSYSFLY